MTGILLHLEIQKGHDAMRQAAYSAELGGTAGNVRMAMQIKVSNSSTLKVHGLHLLPTQSSFGSIIMTNFLALL